MDPWSQIFRNSPIAASHLATRKVGSHTYGTICGLTWVLRIPPQVFTYVANYLPTETSLHPLSQNFSYDQLWSANWQLQNNDMIPKVWYDRGKPSMIQVTETGVRGNDYDLSWSVLSHMINYKKCQMTTKMPDVYVPPERLWLALNPGPKPRSASMLNSYPFWALKMLQAVFCNVRPYFIQNSKQHFNANILIPVLKMRNKNIDTGEITSFEKSKGIT